MTEKILIDKAELQKVLEALDEAANILTSDMFAIAATALRRALEQQPADEPVTFKDKDGNVVMTIDAAEPIRYVYSIHGERIKSAAIDSTIPNGTPLYTRPQPAAPDQPADEPKPPFRFRRFVAGSERAQDVLIERETTIEAAVRKAAKICPPEPMTVLVYDPTTKPRVLEPDYYVYNIDGVYRLADPQPTIRWGKK